MEKKSEVKWVKRLLSALAFSVAELSHDASSPRVHTAANDGSAVVPPCCHTRCDKAFHENTAHGKQ